MRRLALAAALVALALPGAASAGGFAYGVAAGEITPTSAILWTRAPAAGQVQLEVSRSKAFAGMGLDVGLVASAGHDLTVQARVSALAPGARYFYRFRQGAQTSPVGSFVTAPSPEANATIRFGISGDADAAPAKGAKKPFWNEFEVYARMAAEGNDFNVNFGDTIYSDSEVPGNPLVLTVPAKWAKYRMNLALPALRDFRAATGVYSHWDDHEFRNDFTLAEHGKAVYEAGRKAFTDYAPVAYAPQTGLYRTFRWGRNVELFFLDERSFRSAKASAGGACGATPDLAPTAPAAVRAAFASLAPSLANPVPQACLDRIRDPKRTMLGARQLAVFTAAIKASTATFKVVLNEVPLMQFYALPYDRWEGYEAERTKLLGALAGVKNVVVLTTDAHANFIGEIRLQTLEAASPVGTGIWEVVTGPAATRTYSQEIDAALGGTSGVGDAITALFLKPAPPHGVGLTCAATDVFSYAEVRATATTLTVTPRDANGDLVREKTGGPCGPLVIKAR